MAQELLTMAAEWGRSIWDFIGNNAANIIALTAAAVVAIQAWLTREHNRLSVRPHLQTNADRVTAGVNFIYSVHLRNNGLGPAIIKKWMVYLDGVAQELPTHKDVEAFISGLIPNYLHLSTRFIAANEVMRANDSQPLLSLTVPFPSKGVQVALEKQLGRLDLRVEYSSMYGEKLRPLDTRKYRTGYLSPRQDEMR